MRRLEGVNIFVAGGAGRLGTATCKRLASEGARLAVTDLSEADADRLASSIRDAGGEAISGFIDLADHASINAAFTRAEAELGPFLRLHCNGGALEIAKSTDLNALDIDIDVWEHTLRVNLTGYLACARRALPAMIEAKNGAITMMSSGASYLPEDIRVAYGVSKAGINQLVRHIAQAFGKQGVRCNAVAPGAVMEPDFPHMDFLIQAARSHRGGEPEDIAAMVAMLLSDDAEWITGQTFAVDGGLSVRQ